MGLPHHEESLHKLPCPFPPHPQTLQSLIQLGLPWAALNLGGLKNMWSTMLKNLLWLPTDMKRVLQASL